MNDAFVQGVLLHATGEPAAARDAFREALAGTPGLVPAMAYVAICSAEMEEGAAAEEALRRAQEADPTSAFVLYAGALVRRASGHVEAAEGLIDQALARGPACAEYLGVAADLRLGREQAEEALSLARRGLELEPGNRSCLRAALDAAGRLGRDREALSLLQELLEGPGAARGLSAAAWMAWRRGEREVARKVFLEALREAPSLDTAREGLAEVLRGERPVYGAVLRWLLKQERPDRRGLLRSMAEYVLAGAVTDAALRMRRWRWLIIPLLILRFLLTYLSTVSSSLANLMLSSRDDVAVVMSAAQLREAGMARLLLALCAGSVVAIKVTGTVAAWVALFVCMFMLTNVASTFACPAGWPRRVLGGFSVAMLGVGVYALIKLALWDKDWGGWGAFALFLNGSMIGTVASSLLRSFVGGEVAEPPEVV